MEMLERQRMRMEIQDWYRRQCRPCGSSSCQDSNYESSDDVTSYVPSSDSEYGGPYEDGGSPSRRHQCEEREDMSGTLAWRVSICQTSDATTQAKEDHTPDLQDAACQSEPEEPVQ
eukprot:8112561-Prorocentrum_lima.AAC.1